MQFLSKRQSIQAKINAKIAELKEERRVSEASSEESEVSESPYQSPPRDALLSNLTEHQRAKQSYKSATIGLVKYLSQVKKGEGDNEYIHKLLFDFFRTQAVFENQEEDGDNAHIYHRFIEREAKRRQEAESKVQSCRVDKEEVKGEPERMSMKDKLMSGKFCSFDSIPEYGEIEDYRSISSEDQILDQDCLEDLIEKMKRGKSPERSHRKQKRGRGFKKESSSEEREIESHFDSRKSRQRSASSTLKSNRSLHQSRRTSKGYHEDDSSNEAHYDSQESSSSSDEQSEEDCSDAQGLDEDLSYGEEFQPLDMYEQVQLADNQQQYEPYDGGSEKKSIDVEEYQWMDRAQKGKYFRKLMKQYQNELRQVYEERKQMKGKKDEKRQKSVSFSDSIFYKDFRAKAPPIEVRRADEKQEVLVKAIWEYGDQ